MVRQGREEMREAWKLWKKLTKSGLLHRINRPLPPASLINAAALTERVFRRRAVASAARWREHAASDAALTELVGLFLPYAMRRRCQARLREMREAVRHTQLSSALFYMRSCTRALGCWRL